MDRQRTCVRDPKLERQKRSDSAVDFAPPKATKFFLFRKILASLRPINGSRTSSTGLWSPKNRVSKFFLFPTRSTLQSNSKPVALPDDRARVDWFSYSWFLFWQTEHTSNPHAVLHNIVPCSGGPEAKLNHAMPGLAELFELIDDYL